MSVRALATHGKMEHLTLFKWLTLVAFTCLNLFNWSLAVTSTAAPNNNEVYGKTCSKELEANDFLHTYETSNSGCTLDCFILKRNKDAFYTASVTKRHLLSNIQCINETYICLNGTCIVNPLNYNPVPLPFIPDGGVNRPSYRPPSLSRGSATITIHRGFVRYDDVYKVNKGDIYVKVKAGQRFIGRTETHANSYYPYFDETFVIQSLSRSEPLNFELWDENGGFQSDHYINTISTTCDEIMIKRMGGKDKSYIHIEGANEYRLHMTVNCTSF